MNSEFRLDGDRAVLRLADALDVLPITCDAVVVDPPYNLGKAEWDKIPDYLSWSERWIDRVLKGCKAQGAFWCFH